ncbi:DUF2407 C-terminal domain-containing protein [Mycena floridula]|nr:DUF2407 C-terminal domain-containing protein [Mycena floridula]
MLSEKAKGKRRAVDVEGEAPAPAETTAPTRNIVIRFSEGHPDLSVAVGERDSVRNIKEIIRAARPDLKQNRLRLIHSGRLLANGALVYGLLNPRKHEILDNDSESPAAPAWMHCSVGPQLEDLDEDKEDSRQQVAQLQPARGFDRLVAAGFSESDIANFRRQFHSQTASNFLDDRQFDTDEEYEEHARFLEEQWIDSMDNPGSASMSQHSGPNPTLVKGLIIGFFFPFIPQFFLSKPNPPVFWEEHDHEPPESVVFPRSTQVGVIVGLLINLLFGVWTYVLNA